MGLFSLEERRLWGDLTVASQCLNGTHKRGGEREFARAWSDRTRGNGFKLKEGRIRSDIRKKMFPVRVLRHRVPRETVDVSSLEVSKARLDRAWSSLGQQKVSLTSDGME